MPGIAWFKLTDPAGELPPVSPDTDLRVLLPEGDEFAILGDKLSGAGAQVRQVRYLLEDEAIVSDGRHHEAVVRMCRLGELNRGAYSKVTGHAVTAATATFDLRWQDHAPANGPAASSAPAGTLIPSDLAPFLPFSRLNPTQAEIVPEVLEHDQNLLVVAPTGAGKTVIGMAACLKAVIRRGRKAAWLVPQRSLTDELDRELASWRRQGLRVERLSGEYAVDRERIQQADLWVATTEKFEAICRITALREALAEVGALVVDEIHMLGDVTRGPVLEALLARIRDSETETRVVGLSATVSNAEQIADWLQAKLLRTSWRPSRLTWQLPMIPGHADFAVTEAARTRLASAITGLVTGDEGSVIIFCGSKRNVRRTALVIADSRGVNVSGVRQDDTQRLAQVCREARIGLHYQGWEHRKESERAFRRKETDVLIATPTVAAGVNLPARAVIIQDTQVGLNTLDVATVQQMFGRAGRVGAGEDNGWAFMITDEHERPGWQAKLVAGHTVLSRIQGSLPDHVLGEAVQQRISTVADAERWWVRTLAYHQGNRSAVPLRKAVGFLSSAEMLTVGEGRLEPTELGRLTARLMVAPAVCDSLRQSLTEATVPGSADEAEATLAGILATAVPKLAQARAGDDAKPALVRLLAAYDSKRRAPATGLDGGPQRGDLARAALLAVANSPDAFHPGVRQIGGIPYAAMYQILEEMPRYLHWIVCQGRFGTIHPWCAIVAADLERRITWRMLQPPRGAGRLLWACEQMATPATVSQTVPKLWNAARARGHASPDWPTTGRPANCELDDAGYQEFLKDRATGAAIDGPGAEVRVKGPPGSVLAVWTGSAYHVTPIRRGYAVATLPAAEPADPGAGQSGAAVFTWRDDYLATGWLSTYSQARQ
ncbi:MAG: DEAD/DEAH box helicase [Streptosporangiaceae bacterium]